MTEQVSWRVILSVRPDQLKNLKLLTREMVEATRQEDGVLSYERFVTDDGSLVHECYKDSQAAVHYLREFKRRFGEKFSTMVDRAQFVVYGSPTAELKALLDDFQPFYLKAHAYVARLQGKFLLQHPRQDPQGSPVRPTFHKFRQRDTLLLSGVATVIWNVPADRVDGHMAQPLVEFVTTKSTLTRAAVPFRWTFESMAPQFAGKA